MEATVTSRRPHVATSPRRDVSSRSEPYHFKVRMAQTSREIGRHTKGGTNFQKQSDTDFEGVPGIVSLFIFSVFAYIRMMFSLLNICIFSFVMI